MVAGKDIFFSFFGVGGDCYEFMSKLAGSGFPVEFAIVLNLVFFPSSDFHPNLES